MPSDNILARWRQRIIEAPDSLPVWLFMDGDEIVGHCIAEAEIYYGQPFINIHQLEIDRHSATKVLKDEGFQQFLVWVEHLNAVLEQHTLENTEPVRFDVLRFVTPHSARAWARWIPFDLTMEERTLTFTIPSKKEDT